MHASLGALLCGDKEVVRERALEDFAALLRENAQKCNVHARVGEWWAEFLFHTLGDTDGRRSSNTRCGRSVTPSRCPRGPRAPWAGVTAELLSDPGPEPSPSSQSAAPKWLVPGLQPHLQFAPRVGQSIGAMFCVTKRSRSWKWPGYILQVQRLDVGWWARRRANSKRSASTLTEKRRVRTHLTHDGSVCAWTGAAEVSLLPRSDFQRAVRCARHKVLKQTKWCERSEPSCARWQRGTERAGGGGFLSLALCLSLSVRSILRAQSGCADDEGASVLTDGLFKMTESDGSPLQHWTDAFKNN